MDTGSDRSEEPATQPALSRGTNFYFLGGLFFTATTAVLILGLVLDWDGPLFWGLFAIFFWFAVCDSVWGWQDPLVEESIAKKERAKGLEWGAERRRRWAWWRPFRISFEVLAASWATLATIGSLIA